MANVLVIDDESVLLDLIATVLRTDGHSVQATGDPLKALSFLDAGNPPIDLVLTDIDMKPITGFELVKRLTKIGFTGPVLFTSGYASLCGAVTDSLGSRAILEKPFTAAQLRTALGRALAKGKAKSPVASATPTVAMPYHLPLHGTAIRLPRRSS
jgi:DNA-binding NtrC family response regulator